MTFIVKERMRNGVMKICDACGRILIGDTISAEDCFIVERGLICAECVCKIGPIRMGQDDRAVCDGRSY